MAISAFFPTNFVEKEEKEALFWRCFWCRNKNPTRLLVKFKQFHEINDQRAERAFQNRKASPHPGGDLGLTLPNLSDLLPLQEHEGPGRREGGRGEAGRIYRQVRGKEGQFDQGTRRNLSALGGMSSDTKSWWNCTFLNIQTCLPVCPVGKLSKPPPSRKGRRLSLDTICQ